jgi:hypothetical protein
MIPTEHDEQRYFIQWFRLQHPDILIIAIPNGGRRSIGVARKMKEEGVVPGVPDMYIPAWHCWIEIKRAKGGKLSHEQKSVIKYLQGIGDTVIVAAGATNASEQVEEMRRK